MDDLFKSLGIDKIEWLEDIKHGDSSSSSFMAFVERSVLVKEKVGSLKRDLTPKLSYIYIYKWFGKCVEFKEYLHGICDAGNRLLFKFRLDTHGLNKELGRHRWR